MNFKFVALDTNIFIYYFESNEIFGQKAKSIFDQLTDNKLTAVVNITALAELLSSSKLSKKAVKETKKLFLSIPNLEIYQVDETIATEGAEIRREYGFRLFDSIQLATARLAKAQAFITNDGKLRKFKDLKIILIKDI
mgnify:CR=1 FL=1